MKALVFERRIVDDIKIAEYKDPEVRSHDVLIRVKNVGVSPVDYLTVTLLNVNPIPHIPGVEFAGVVEKVGEHVKSVKVGDKVTIFGSIFDGTCDMCMEGYETICRNGGRIGIETNGGMAELISLEEKYVFKLPEEYDWKVASSLPVSGLTAYHSLKEAKLHAGETLVVFGASGGTGQFLVQLGRKMGAKVIAVSRKNWLKELGADVVVGYENVEEVVKNYTNNKMADVVVNSLGSAFWEKGFSVLGNKGRLVTFGDITGAEVKLDLRRLYLSHQIIMGIFRGNRKDLLELMELCKECKIKVWKTFTLDEGRDAINSIYDKERDGKIILEVS
ncbi:alcohol dehydrogenase catalytic domain-containing protein [Sulfolobus tengchongensis]|uniref:Alcohol dehydrogenase catalytic domain-containing protein n=1 Tax=Sulfolobus tengchongensis TaxID=207809 RepID=A0AAX4KXX7_9CREN